MTDGTSGSEMTLLEGFEVVGDWLEVFDGILEKQESSLGLKGDVSRSPTGGPLPCPGPFTNDGCEIPIHVPGPGEAVTMGDVKAIAGALLEFYKDLMKRLRGAASIST